MTDKSSEFYTPATFQQMLDRKREQSGKHSPTVYEKNEITEGFKPNLERCCERCVFRTGKHADWCNLKRPDSRKIII